MYAADMVMSRAESKKYYDHIIQLDMVLTGYLSFQPLLLSAYFPTQSSFQNYDINYNKVKFQEEWWSRSKIKLGIGKISVAI